LRRLYACGGRFAADDDAAALHAGGQVLGAERADDDVYDVFVGRLDAHAAREVDFGVVIRECITALRFHGFDKFPDRDVVQIDGDFLVLRRCRQGGQQHQDKRHDKSPHGGCPVGKIQAFIFFHD